MSARDIDSSKICLSLLFCVRSSKSESDVHDSWTLSLMVEVCRNTNFSLFRLLSRLKRSAGMTETEKRRSEGGIIQLPSEVFLNFPISAWYSPSILCLSPIFKVSFSFVNSKWSSTQSSSTCWIYPGQHLAFLQTEWSWLHIFPCHPLVHTSTHPRNTVIKNKLQLYADWEVNLIFVVT